MTPNPKPNDGSLLLPSVNNADGFKIAFSTKKDGNMYRTNETRVAVHENRLRFLNKAGVDPSDLCMIRPSHSANVEIFERGHDKYLRTVYLQAPVIETDFDYYYTGADGAITFDRSVSIGLASGDCVPVVLWDRATGMHGILHVGLLGALNAMVKILPRLFADHRVDLRHVNFYLGPSISQQNYDVAKSGLWKAIADQAYAKVPNVRSFMLRRGDGDFFDVKGMIVKELMELGVPERQIQRYEHCVAEPDSIFFSHNVLKTTGEHGSFLSVIGGQATVSGT